MSQSRRAVLALPVLVAIGLAAPPLAAARPAPAAITRVDDHTYRVVTTKLADELRGHGREQKGSFPFQALTRSAALVPLVRDGRPEGFRLLRVDPAGPLGRLGFRNEDVVKSLNGIAIGSPEQALRAYAAVKSTSRLTVAFDREGRARTVVVILL